MLEKAERRMAENPTRVPLQLRGGDGAEAETRDNWFHMILTKHDLVNILFLRYLDVPDILNFRRVCSPRLLQLK